MSNDPLSGLREGSLDPAINVPRAVRRAGISRAKELLWNLVPPLAFLGFFVGVVYAASYLILSPARQFLLPPPHDVVRNGLLDGKHLNEQLTALWDTTQVSVTGLAIAFVLGGLIAVAMSQAKWI